MRSVCENCRYWITFAGPRDAADPALGECRRYPPSTEVTEDEYWSHWPVTTSVSWCGEYQRESH